MKRHRSAPPVVLGVLLSVLMVPDLAAGDPGGHFVRVPAPDFARASSLGLSPKSALDYGTFVWMDVSDDDLERLKTAGLPFEVRPEAFTLRLGERSFDPLAGEPQLAPGWDAVGGPPSSGPDLHLVQFAGPTRAEWTKRLERRGLEIVQYIPPFTYVVWGDAATRANSEAAEMVRWTGPFAPAYRVLPKWRNLSEQHRQVRVLMYRGTDTEAVVRAIEELGGAFTTRKVLNHVFEVAGFLLPGNAMRSAARIPGVYSIQPVPTGGLRGEMSDQVNVNNVDGTNLAFPGYTAWLSGVGLDGSGVIIANVDSGVDQTHSDLAGRFLSCTGVTCAGGVSSGHGTHTAGLTAATGASGVLDGYGFLRGLGVAPGANLIEQLYSPWYTQPDGMLLLMTESYNNGASASSNSWGWPGEQPGIPPGYDNGTMQVDIGVRDADPDTPGNQPLTYVLAFENGYGGTSTQGAPDGAKNNFTIGSTKMQLSNGDQILEINDLSHNTAHGPALDGRTIPHMVAPGCFVDSAYTPSPYWMVCGTSMAAPQVSGAVALFIEWYRNSPIYQGDPSPALIKAAFLPVARDLAGNLDADGGILGHPFDSKQGWGRLDLEAVIDPPLTARYFDNPVVFDNTGEQWTRTVTAEDPNAPLRIMLVWTDAPGHGLGGSTPAWNNDLDLVVECTTGTYRGNNFDVSGWSITGGIADIKNNTEGIFIGPTAPETYTIRVLATDINSDAIPGVGDLTDQDFAVACYNCAEEPTFYVAATPGHLDICTPDDAVYDVEVGSVAGFSNPITLSASGEPAGTTVNFSTNGVRPPGTSVMTIGNTNAATNGLYNIDIQGEDPSSSDVRYTSVSLNVVTSVPGVVTLLTPPDGAIDVLLMPTFAWSENPEALTYEFELATDIDFTDIVHSTTTSDTSLTLETALDPVMQYYWHVASINICGSGGFSAPYGFTTLGIVNCFTELFTSDDNDLDNTSLTFTPDGSGHFYSGCSDPIISLPTDPSGGTVLTLAPNSYAPVALGGPTVWLYGTGYGTIYPGSNGYVTFTGGDIDYTETLADHFDMPRVSALFDNLDPSAETGGGTVSWKLLADRVAVTWENVPEQGTANSNTFQMELYFDETIVISYMTIDAMDGLAGLSEGNGTPAGFTETNLSAMPSCGPRPPIAEDTDVVTPVNTPVLITLQATDDGLPDPPGMLTYVITSLPDHGDLTDPVAGPVTSVPHTLAGNGNQAEYQPLPGYPGSDSFEFKANDGGTPPEGGDSNTAVVSITIGIPQLIHDFPLDSDPGWSTEGAWAFGRPTGGGGEFGSPDPTSGYTGTNGYGYNLDGDYTDDMPVYYLTTTALDCTAVGAAVTNVELRFWKWLGVESSIFDHANIQVSNDGAFWTTVWEHDGGHVTDDSWSEMAIDISAVADNQPVVYIRWGMGPTDHTNTYCGWNLDDVQIWARVTLETCNDGIKNQGEYLVDCGGPCPPCECQTNGDCDDGLFCTGAATCDTNGICQVGPDPCPGQMCNEELDACVECLTDGDCPDDGLFCTVPPTCDTNGNCQPGPPNTCDDGVGCTVDLCDEVNDTCVNTSSNGMCDNGDYCDGVETCDPVLDCQAGTSVDCGDGIGCTVDSCDEVNDTCVNAASNGLCANGDLCDGIEICDPLLDCQAGTPPDCNDGIGCTIDSCDPAAGCVNAASNGLCANGDLCDGIEICDPLLDCQAGTPLDCNDGIDCTIDTCDAAIGCVNTASNGLCDDSVGCTIDSCDAATGCVNATSNGLCANGDLCDGIEICDPLLDCQAGTPLDCNDGIDCTIDTCDAAIGCVNTASNGLCDDSVGCTIDSCDPATGCVNAASNGLCANGDLCDGIEICDPLLDCQAGTPLDCNDGINCTIDTCDAAIGCINTASNGLCDDSIGCTIDSCDPATGCVNATSNGLCANGDLCDGIEICDPLLDCQAGTPLDCNDGVGCTIDTCDPLAGCVNTTSNGVCDNGEFCDGVETCDPVLDCQPGMWVDCDDAIGCTVDWCDEVNDTCVNAASNGLCDNGVFCDGIEFCDPLLDCQYGPDPCPGQYCREYDDTCLDCLNNTHCDDGAYCNGDEWCDTNGLCQPGVDPCPGQYCRESDDLCVECLTNGHCDDGTFCNGAEICDTNGFCQPGIEPCVDQAHCDEDADICLECLDNSECDDGLFCNGAETCGTNGFCEPGEDPCPGQLCRESDDTCVDCLTAEDCDDANVCTDNTCVDGFCEFPNNTAPCDDGLFCTATDVCGGGVCVGSGDPCEPGEICNEANDTCNAGRVYDFSVNGGLDRFAFGTYTNSWVEDLEGIRRQCPEVCTPVTDITPDAYDRLAFSDATGGDTDPNRYINPDPASQQDESTLVVEFNIPNNPADVLQIDVLWEGYGDNDHHIELYIWDYVQGNWGNGAGLYGANTFMDDGSGSADFILSGSVTANIGNYISPTGEITLLIYDDQRSEESFHDYVSIAVTVPVPECYFDTDCNDDNPCTDDTCVDESCVFTPNEANSCEDGLFCNGVETCDSNGICQPGTPVDCGDTVTCTVDSCDEINDVCVNAASNGLCDNGDACDGVEVCDPLLDCQAGTPPDCNDGINCTIDTCDPATGCVNAASNGLCDNGDFCDGVETCDPVLDCQAGTAVDCEDGVGCTLDMCDEVNDTCFSVPNNGLCDNGNFCDGIETCDPLLDCQAGTPPDCSDGINCTVDTCDPATGCVNAASNGLCDNGQFCDGVEVCDPVLDCQAGTSVDCDDGVGCTFDMCNEVDDTCFHMPNNALCDNGDFCDGVETCDPVLDCQAGTPPDCSDGVNCTVDTCDPATGCVNTASNGLCNDTNVCTDDTCDPVNDCEYTNNTAPCDDGLWCTVNDTCSGGTCSDTLPRDCGDTVGCTVDTCDEVADTCVNVASNGLCDNGDACDGIETCDPLLDCQLGTPLDCDDGNPCTDDWCEPASGCQNVPNDANPCSDGVACTDDVCSNGVCVGVDNCPVGEMCDPGTGECVIAPVFTAYNDVVYDPALHGTGTDPNGQSVHYIAPNVTAFGIGNGFTGSTFGQLLDQVTGDPTGVIVTLTQSGGVNWNPMVGDPWHGGYDSALDTDARNTFGGIADMTGTVWYGSIGWWVDLTFTSLDPQRRHAFATTASRAKQNTDGPPGYPDRYTLYTILGVDAATNASTPGTEEYLGDPWSVTFNTGDNHDEGYVARWTDIEPGTDGSFAVRAEAHPAALEGRKAYAFDVFMLQAFPECTSNADCDDGLFCSGTETCEGETGICVSSGNPCSAGAWCDETNDTCVPHGNGDFEPDGDVDLADFAALQGCFGHSALGGCEPGNMIGADEMIDLADVATFVAALDAGGPL